MEESWNLTSSGVGMSRKSKVAMMDTSMKIKELRKKTKMSQSEFSSYFGISIRTLQQWEQGRRTPPPYLIGLMERILNLEFFK